MIHTRAIASFFFDGFSIKTSEYSNEFRNDWFSIDIYVAIYIIADHTVPFCIDDLVYLYIRSLENTERATDMRIFSYGLKNHVNLEHCAGPKPGISLVKSLGFFTKKIYAYITRKHWNL